MKFGDDCGCIGNRNNRSEIMIWKSSCQLIHDRHKGAGEPLQCKESANSQCRHAIASFASHVRNEIESAKEKNCYLDDSRYKEIQKMEAYCKGL